MLEAVCTDPLGCGPTVAWLAQCPLAPGQGPQSLDLLQTPAAWSHAVKVPIAGLGTCRWARDRSGQPQGTWVCLLCPMATSFLGFGSQGSAGCLG